MKQRRAAWLLWCLAAGFVALAALLFFLNRSTVVPATWGSVAGPSGTLLNTLDFLLTSIGYGLVTSALGALIASRQRHNPIGWLLVLAGLCFALNILVVEYTVWANFTRAGAAPGARAAAWIMNWLWIVSLYMMIGIVVLFPDGRLPHGHGARRARLATAVILAGFVAMLVTRMIAPRMDSAFDLPNPLPIPLRAGEFLHLVIFSMAVLLLLFSVVLATLVLLARFGAATPVQRQQFKWLVAMGILTALDIVAGVALTFGAGLTAGQLLVNNGFLLLAAGFGLAILRHRLYDVDLLIRRTLIYSVLTASLAAIYVSSVIVLQTILRPLVGVETDLATVASTLVIAALFGPLRRRIQQAIDQHFYRRTYNAQQTLDAFSARLRDETDLPRLTTDMLDLIHDTIHPTHVSLWLRESPTPRDDS